MAPAETPEIDGLNASTPSGARWGQDRRLEFIEYRLLWNERLNRSDLTSYFGISVPQASLDVSEYARRAPENLEYDRSTRTYVASANFRPIFQSSNLERYLEDLLNTATNRDAVYDSFLGWHPPVAITPRPGRHLNTSIVKALVKGIHDGSALKVRYQSFSQPDPSLRMITPHAIAHDGSRFHIRAYCHSRNQFLDFLISRILEIEGTEQDRSRSADDAEWHNIVRLVLAPHPALAETHRKVIELDYGMTNGVCEFECRQALLFYVLRQLGLEQESSRSPEAQQIILSNRAELEQFLPSTRFR
jgi:hypothetical protein